MFGSSSHGARPASSGPSYSSAPPRPPSPSPRSFAPVGAGSRGFNSTSNTGSNYTFARPPSPSHSAQAARPPSPVRPSSWSTPRYIPAPSPARPATPPGHRRRPSFDLPSPTPAPRWGGSPTGPKWGAGTTGKKVDVHGDSFVGVFETLQQGSVRITKYKGASAKGLNSLSSTLGVGPKLLKHVETTRPSHLCLVFGHVDLHINYLWQLKARGPGALKPSDWVRSVVQQYTAFIADELLPRFGGVVYVAGVTPPVVDDYYLEECSRKYTEKEQAGLLPPLSRSYHSHDITTRRAMVRAYNQLLASFCSSHPQLEFVCINRHLTLGGGDQVSPSFIDPVDPTNIHLLWERTIGLWCAEIPPLRGATTKDTTTLEATLSQYHQDKTARMRRNSVTRILMR